MSNKSKGIAFERKTRHYLESLGFWCIRQAASAFPDLIAISPLRTVYVIECKLKPEYLTRAEKNEMVSLAERLGGIPMLAYNLKGKVILKSLY